MSDIFDYDNLIGRPPGKYLRVGSKLSKGIRSVQRQIPLYAAEWLGSNASELRSDKPLWVVLGDSMAQGIGASSFEGGWPGQLRTRLLANGRNYRMINLSISGARIGDVLERQLPAMATLGVEPALVTMMIGSNNLLRKTYRAEAPAQYAQVLARLPTGSIVANLPGNGTVQAAIYQQLQEQVAAGRLVMADMRAGSPRSWRGKLAVDHFHPNDDGYTILAEAFARSLKI